MNRGGADSYYPVSLWTPLLYTGFHPEPPPPPPLEVEMADMTAEEITPILLDLMITKNLAILRIGDKMENIVSLPQNCLKEILRVKLERTIQVGYNSEDIAGIRAISGLVDGKKVTYEWNLTEAKNVGRSNATTAQTQAEFEAQAEWTKKADKDFFEDIQTRLILPPPPPLPMLAHDFAKTPVTSGIFVSPN